MKRKILNSKLRDVYKGTLLLFFGYSAYPLQWLLKKYINGVRMVSESS